jgi:hypothetical protein
MVKMMMRAAPIFLATFLAVGCGYGSNYNGMPSPGATAPSITELVPNDMAHGNPAFTITINGSGFGTGAVVFWNGAPLATSYVTGMQVTAAVPADNIANAGDIPVYVRSGSKNSNTLTFTVQ